MTKLKKGPVILQAEVKNDDEWNELLLSEGLIVVDIYCEWSGPCTAMESTLKKIKMEIGGDLLNCALACNDEITALKRFRGNSQPVWMFIQNGKMVNLFFGSHCPNFKKVLIKEIKRIHNKEPPNFELSVDQRTPYEEVRFMEEETIKRLNALQKRSKEEALERIQYEEFLKQMMIQLCEETALIIYPWVFLDENGHKKAQEKSVPYTELVSKILPDRFEILERIKIQLDENMIEKMLKESNIKVTDDLIYVLTQGKCVAMRLKGRPPPSTWPVPYPNVCIEESKKCPTRALNDVENFLEFILKETLPNSNQDNNPQSFLDRYTLLLTNFENEEKKGEEEEEGEEMMWYPAVWFPLNARNKVHVFKTLFSSYMDRSHPYEKPQKPLPLIAFKFDISKFSILSECYQQFRESVAYFGVFEYDDPRSRKLATNPQEYLHKITHYTGNEIILVIIRKTDEKVFLAFAGNYPIVIEDNGVDVAEIIHHYFIEDICDFDVDASFQDHYEEAGENDDMYEEYRDVATFY